MTSNLAFRRDRDGKPLWHNPLPNEDFDPSRPYQPDNSPFATCALCGEPWPCQPTKDGISPIEVSGIWLRSRSPHVLEVLAEIEGEWRVVIRTEHQDDDLLSHFVEPLGMRHAVTDLLTARTPDAAAEEETP